MCQKAVSYRIEPVPYNNYCDPFTKVDVGERNKMLEMCRYCQMIEDVLMWQTQLLFLISD